MSSGKVGASLDWSFGLRNSADKYLTAETFGNKIVCAASIMKKKQIFFLEQDSDDAEFVFIKSHLNKYLSVDGDGKFTCDADEKGEEQQLVIEPQASGKWAIKSKKYGWYTGGTGENLTAFVSEISDDRLWTVHLAMHPQINLYNVQRKAYVHVDGGSFSTDEIVPWGDDATVNIVFNDVDGTYSIQSCSGLFLAYNGSLVESNTDEKTHFILEFRGGKVSFKTLGKDAKYLTALGSAGTLKAVKPIITKDEQFTLEDSFPQISIRGKNKLFLSTKQGIEVAATANSISDSEIFQLEPLGPEDFDKKSATFAIKSHKPLYFKMEGNSVICNESDASRAGQFEIEWLGSEIAIKSKDTGKYVEQQLNKYLVAKADTITEGARFTYEIVNRPNLVLRGEYGFVGTLPSGLLECNKSTADSFNCTIKDGDVALANNDSGKFWKVNSNGVSANGDSAENYNIEIYDNSKLAIKFGDKYFQSNQNGAFTATGTKIDKYTLFEY